MNGIDRRDRPRPIEDTLLALWQSPLAAIVHESCKESNLLSIKSRLSSKGNGLSRRIVTSNPTWTMSY